MAKRTFLTEVLEAKSPNTRAFTSCSNTLANQVDRNTLARQETAITEKELYEPRTTV